MTLPPGFLGTRADLFMDVVIVTVALVPALLWAGRALARARAYQRHRQLQLLLTGVFVVVVGLFEVYIRWKGGVDGISVGSPWHQSTPLYTFLGVHLTLAIGSSVLWGWLTWASVRRFDNPPGPGAFSAQHRRWGTITMTTMALTAITGLGLYWACFVA